MRPFTYNRTASAEGAAQAAAQPAVKLIAGGTNSLDLMTLQVETPATLVDINRLPLDWIEDTPKGGLRIGALVRNSDLAAEARLRRRYPVLSRALPAGAAVANAICNACGARIRDYPITLDKVLAKLLQQG